MSVFWTERRGIHSAYIIFLALLLVSTYVQAAAINWSGNTAANGGSVWSTGNNWVGNTVPTSSDNAVVDYSNLVAGGLFPEVSSANTVGDLSLLSGNLTLSANLDVLGNALADGNLTIQDDLAIFGDLTGNATSFILDAAANLQVGGDLNLILSSYNFGGKLIFTGTQQLVEVNGASLNEVEIRSSSSTGNVVFQSNINVFDIDIYSGNLDIGSNHVQVNTNMGVDGTLNISGGNLNLLNLGGSTYQDLTVRNGATLKMSAGSNLMVRTLTFEAGSNFIGEGAYGITVFGDVSIQTTNWNVGSGNIVLTGLGSNYDLNTATFYDLTLGTGKDIAFSGTNLLVNHNLLVSSQSSMEFQDTPLTVGGNLTNANLMIFDGAQPLLIQTMDNTQGTLKFDKVSGGNINIRPVNGSDPTFELYDLIVLNGPYSSSTNLSIGNTLMMNTGATLSASNIAFDKADPWATAGTLEVENGFLTTSSAGNVDLDLVSGANLTVRNSTFAGALGPVDSLTGSDAEFLFENLTLTVFSNLIFDTNSVIHFADSTLNTGVLALSGSSSANFQNTELTSTGNVLANNSFLYTSDGNISIGTHFDLLSTSTLTHETGDWSVGGNLNSTSLSTITYTLGDLVVSGETSLSATQVTTTAANLTYSGNADFIGSTSLTHSQGNLLVMGNAQFTTLSNANFVSDNVWIQTDFRVDDSTLTTSTNFFQVDGTSTVTGTSIWTSSSNIVEMNDEATVSEGGLWTTTGGEITMAANLNITSTLVAASNLQISSSNLELSGDLIQDTGYFSFLLSGNANFSSNITAADSSIWSMSSGNATVSENIHFDSSTMNTISTTLGVSGKVGLSNSSSWTSESDRLIITEMVGLTTISSAGFSGTGATLSTNQLISSTDSIFKAETGMTITLSDSISELSLGDVSGTSYLYHVNINSGITTIMSTNVTFKGNLMVNGTLDQNGQDLYLDSGNMSLALGSVLSNSANLLVTGTAFYGDAKSGGSASDIGYVDIDSSANLSLTNTMRIGGNLINGGIFVVGGETIVDIDGDLDNSGTIALHGDVNFPDPNASIIDRGTFNFIDGASGVVTLGSQTPATYKNLTLSGSQTYYVNSTLTVTETLLFLNGANLFLDTNQSLTLETDFIGSYDDIINDGEIVLQGGTDFTITGVMDNFGDLKLNQASTNVTVGSDLSVELLTLGTGSNLNISGGSNLVVAGNALNVFSGASIGSESGSNLIFTGNTTYTNNGTSTLQNIWIKGGSNLSLLTDIEVDNEIWVDVNGILTTFDGVTDYAISALTLDNDGTVFTYETGTVNATMQSDAGLVWMTGTNGPYNVGTPWFDSFYELKMSDDWVSSSDLTFNSRFYSDNPLEVTISSDNTLTLNASSVTLTDNILLASSGANLSATAGELSLSSNLIVAEGSFFDLNHLSIGSFGNVTSLGNSTLAVAGNFHILGNWSEGMSHLTLGGGGNYVGPGESFYELSMNGSNLLMEDVVTVSTNLNVVAGNLLWSGTTSSTGNLLVEAGGNFSLTGGNLSVGSNLTVQGLGSGAGGNITIGEALTLTGTWEHLSGDFSISGNADLTSGTWNHQAGEITVGGYVGLTSSVWTHSAGNVNISGNLSSNGGTWTHSAGDVDITGDVFLNGGGAWTHTSGNLVLGGNAQLDASTWTLTEVSPDYNGSLNLMLSQTSTFNVSDNLSLLLSIPDGDLNHSGGDLTFPNGAWFGGNYTWNSGAGNVGVTGGNLTIDTSSTFNLGTGGNLVLADGVVLHLLGDLIAQPGSNVSLGTLTVYEGDTQFNGATVFENLNILGGNVTLAGGDNVSITDIVVSGDGNLMLDSGAVANLSNLTLSGGNVELSESSSLTLAGNLVISGGNFIAADNSLLSFSSNASLTSSLAMTDLGILGVNGDALSLNLAYLSTNTLLIGSTGNLIQGSNTLVVTEAANISTGGMLWNASGNLDLEMAMVEFSTGSNMVHGGLFDLYLLSGSVDGGFSMTSANLISMGALTVASGANLSGMDLRAGSSTWTTSGELSFANLILTSSLLTNSGTLELSGGVWVDASSNLQQDAGSLSVTGSVNVAGGVFDLNASTPDVTAMDLVIDGGATVELSDNFSDNLVFLSGTMTQQSGNLNLVGDLSIAGDMVVNGDSTWNLPMGSNVTVESGAELTIGSSGNLNFSSGVDFYHQGDIQVDSGAVMSIGNIIFDGSNINLGNFSSVSLGNVIVRDGTVTLSTGNTSLNQLTVENGGGLVFPSAANLTLAEDFLIYGDLTMNSTAILQLQSGDIYYDGGNDLGILIVENNTNLLNSSLFLTELWVTGSGTFAISDNSIFVYDLTNVANGGLFTSGAGATTISLGDQLNLEGYLATSGVKVLASAANVTSSATLSANLSITGTGTSLVVDGTMIDGHAFYMANGSSVDLYVKDTTMSPSGDGADLIVDSGAMATIKEQTTLENLTLNDRLDVEAPLTIEGQFENNDQLYLLLGSSLSVTTMDINSGTINFWDTNGTLNLGGVDSPNAFYNLTLAQSSGTSIALNEDITVNGALISTDLPISSSVRLLNSGSNVLNLGGDLAGPLGSDNLSVSGCVVMTNSSQLYGNIYTTDFSATSPNTSLITGATSANLYISGNLSVQGNVSGNITMNFSASDGGQVILEEGASANLNYVEFNDVHFSTRTFAYNSKQVDSTNLVTEFVELVQTSGTNVQGVVDVSWTQVYVPGEDFPDIYFYQTNAAGDRDDEVVSGNITVSDNTFAWNTVLSSDANGSFYLGAFSSTGLSLSQMVIGPFTLDNHLNLNTPDGLGRQMPRFNPVTAELTFNFDHPVDGVDVSLISLDGTFATNLSDRVLSTDGNGTEQPTLILDDLGILAIAEAANLILSPSAYTWNGNTFYSTNTNSFFVETDDTEPTQIDWALDFNKEQLTIEFSEPISLTGLSASNITLIDDGSGVLTLDSSSTISRDPVAPANIIVDLVSADVTVLEAFTSWNLILSTGVVQDLFGLSYSSGTTTNGNVVTISANGLADAIAEGTVTGQEVFTSLFEDTSSEITRAEQLELASSLYATVSASSTLEDFISSDGKTWFAAYYSTNTNSGTLPTAATPLPSFTVTGIPEDTTFTALVTPAETSEVPPNKSAVSSLLSFHLTDNDTELPYTGSFSIVVSFLGLSESPVKFSMYRINDNGSFENSNYDISSGGDSVIDVTFTAFSNYILVIDEVSSPFASGGGGGCLLSPEAP